jgi:hypothetical protein
VTSGFPRDLREAYFIEQFSDWGHFGHEPLLHQAAFLAAGIGVQLVVEANGGKLFLPEPGLERHVQADVHCRAVSRQHDDILDAIRKADRQGPLQAGGHRVLIAEQGMDVVDGHMREDQAGAAGRADHDGVFRVGERGEHIAKRHGLGTSGTERVLFNEFLGGADIFPSPVFLAIRGMIDQILIVQRHDVIQIRGYSDAFFAHVVFSF